MAQCFCQDPVRETVTNNRQNPEDEADTAVLEMVV